MSFLSKESLSSSAHQVPYPEVLDAHLDSLAYKQRVHEDSLQTHFKSVANSLFLRFQKKSVVANNEPPFAFDPGAFHYYRYCQQRFLSIKDILGSPEEAEAYYRKRYEEAFPDFHIVLKRRPNEAYAYSVLIDF